MYHQDACWLSVLNTKSCGHVLKMILSCYKDASFDTCVPHVFCSVWDGLIFSCTQVLPVWHVCSSAWRDGLISSCAQMFVMYNAFSAQHVQLPCIVGNVLQTTNVLKYAWISSNRCVQIFLYQTRRWASTLCRPAYFKMVVCQQRLWGGYWKVLFHLTVSRGFFIKCTLEWSETLPPKSVPFISNPVDQVAFSILSPQGQILL